MMLSDDLEGLAAVHEAGHTVAALALGCEIARVSIGARGAGNTRMGLPRSRRDAVSILLAGTASEALALGRAHLELAQVEQQYSGAGVDLALARLRCHGVPGLPIEVAWRETIDLLSARWPAVELLAAVLKAEGEVGGRRAAAIVAEHGGHR